MRISVKPNTYIYLVFLIFLFPLNWLLAWLLAMLFHELCHWTAVKLCGGEVYGLEIGVGGADMQCANLMKWLEFICILSGPLGGLLPVLLAQWFPRLAFCCLLLSTYNLLPVLPLDGGRALEILVGSPIFCCMQRIFLIIALLLCLYSVFVLELGILPVVIVLVLLIKNRKSPCKCSPKTVQ